MEAQCGDDSSADAQAGEALHLAVETCNVADLSPDDAELVQKARTYLFGLADSWEFEHLCTIKGVTYGWADAIAVLPERVIVVDFKFVWLDLARIMATWQMAAYAVALYEEFHKPVEAYVYCPRLEQAFDCPPYPYEQTLVRIKEVIATSRRPDAPLHVQPEACKYCKARAICPELNRELSVVVADRTQLTPTTRAKRREFLALVETWAERVRTEDRQFMLDGGEIPGWEIRKRQGPRFIPDAYTAWLHLHDHLSPSEIMISQCDARTCCPAQAGIFCSSEVQGIEGRMTWRKWRSRSSSRWESGFRPLRS
jgi:hypothetical protein